MTTKPTINISCPTCGAQFGSPCVTIDQVPMTRLHRARILKK